VSKKRLGADNFAGANWLEHNGAYVCMCVWGGGGTCLEDLTIAGLCGSKPLMTTATSRGRWAKTSIFPPSLCSSWERVDRHVR